MAILAPILVGTAATAGTAGAATTLGVAAVAGGASAVGIAGTAATVGLIGSAGVLSTSALISGGLSVISAVGSIQAGRSEAAALKGRANFADFRAQQAIVAGDTEAARISMAFARQLGTALAGGAAGGISLVSGSPVDTLEAASRDAGLELEINRANAEIEAGTSRFEARQFRVAASRAKDRGTFGAVQSLVGFGLKRADAGFLA
jgi:hypothetical protein